MTQSTKNIVLVHGGFVDGSAWESVYGLLKNDGDCRTLREASWCTPPVGSMTILLRQMVKAFITPTEYRHRFGP